MPHSQFTAPVSSDERFLDSLYRAILRRPPDESTLAAALHGLHAGVPRLILIASILESNEYAHRKRTDEDFVQDLYRGVLGREPDNHSGELQYWVARLSRDTRVQVLRIFLSEPEVAGLYSSTATFKQRLYWIVNRIRRFSAFHPPKVPILRTLLSRQIARGDSGVNNEPLNYEALNKAVDRTNLLHELKYQRLERLLRELNEGFQNVNSDTALAGHIGQTVSHMSSPVADFLNWATGAEGYAAQRELFFNHPVFVAFGTQGKPTTSINERIVELPYAFAGASRLKPGSSVLDFGCCESLLSLTLAVQGFHVFALDRRPYRLHHPNLTSVVSLAEDWKGPPEPLDAVFCISSIEHAGLPAYGMEATEPDGDLHVMRRLADWTKPSGTLVFTSPFGRHSVNDFQRIYDASDLKRLLEAWDVTDEQFFTTRAAESIWCVSDESSAMRTSESGGRSVVLITAQRRPS